MQAKEGISSYPGSFAVVSPTEARWRKSLCLSIEVSEEKEYYALSSQQKYIYNRQQIPGTDTGYHVTQYYKLPKDSDLKKTEKIFRELLTRHDTLRTSITAIEGEIVQRIHRKVEFKIEYYPVVNPGRKEPCKEGLLYSSPQVEKIMKNFVRPFELSMPPLLRVGVIETQNNNILMVDMHQIIADGISHLILANEFTASYSGDKLPPVKFHYKDYSEWKRSKKVRELLAQQEEYWANQFSDE